MFDQVLAKAAFLMPLEEKGVPKEKIDEEWAKIEKLFIAAILKNLFSNLSDNELRSITTNLSPDKPEEIKTVIENLAAFLKNNPSRIPQDLIDDAIRETYTNYEKTLT